MKTIGVSEEVSQELSYEKIILTHDDRSIVLSLGDYWVQIGLPNGGKLEMISNDDRQFEALEWLLSEIFHLPIQEVERYLKSAQISSFHEFQGGLEAFEEVMNEEA